MKIGILLISNGWSGAEKVVYEILKNIPKNEEIVLMTNNEMIKYYKGLTKNRKIVIWDLGKLFDKGLKRFLNIIKIRSKIKQYIFKNNFDVLNLHLEYSFLLTYLNLPKNGLLVPVLHGVEAKKFNEFSYKKFSLLGMINKLILRYALRKSKKIVSVSNHQIQNLTEKYKQKTIVIPNGVDSKKFQTIKNIKQKKKAILFVGRYFDWKGIREIVNVAKWLPQYEFWFAGQGSLDKEIFGKNTKNLGFKTTEELKRLYNKSRVCIFPSWHEPFGLVGLEAMSCGRAVIATPLGFSEYIENGKDGIIIPVKDENALKNAIEDLMTNEKKRKMLEKNARKKALKYSWDKIAQRYLEVFKEVDGK